MSCHIPARLECLGFTIGTSIHCFLLLHLCCCMKCLFFWPLLSCWTDKLLFLLQSPAQMVSSSLSTSGAKLSVCPFPGLPPSQISTCLLLAYVGHLAMCCGMFIPLTLFSVCSSQRPSQFPVRGGSLVNICWKSDLHVLDFCIPALFR